MPLTDAEKTEIKKTWAKREKELLLQEKRRKADALEKARAIARHLKQKYSVKNVYLYGSLAKEGLFDRYSDIDIFIDGWDEKFNYWSMYLEVEQIASPLSVNIVTNNDVLPSLLKTIYKEGKIL